MTVTEAAPAADEKLVQDRVAELVKTADPSDPTSFWGTQFDLGLAWVHFPEGHGGLGVNAKLQEVVGKAVRKLNVPSNFARNPMGVGMAAPTIVTHGSDEQKAKYLRRIFTCEDIWCQMFSEPGAGSDVAGLSSKAVRDGDEWIVNGQKVWTTLAHISKWGLLVVRTNPDQPKHKGLTYFVVDMHAPGVEVKPLRQMTGEAEFNEVFFTDARIPDSERLGDVGDGWRVALTTLMNERVAIGANVIPRGAGPIAEAVRIYKERGITDAATRDELMKLWSAAETARLTNIRASQNRRMGNPGPEGSTSKLVFAELNKRIYEFCMNLLGPEGMLYDTYKMIRPDEAGGFGRDVRKSFLRSRANSIEGGTSEVMRNILGERVLGLPGDVRVDKDRPWTEVPRS